MDKIRYVFEHRETKKIRFEYFTLNEVENSAFIKLLSMIEGQYKYLGRDLYIGIYDQNNEDIYENDILEFDKKEWRGEDNKRLVLWDNKHGAWEAGGGLYNECYQLKKIIGNKWQNSGLLY